MPTTTFVWDPVNDCVISELDGTGATQAVYTNEPQQYGGVLSQRRGSTSSFLHADALGTTRLLTSTAGATTDTYLFDAWGNPVSSTGSTINPFRWVGRYGYYTDNTTGLLYVRARMYQPTIARWVSVDPLALIDTPDLYLYCNNNGMNLLDPSGLIAIPRCIAECEDECAKFFPHWYQWPQYAGCVNGCPAGCNGKDFTFCYYWVNQVPQCNKDVIQCICGIMEIADIVPQSSKSNSLVVGIAECFVCEALTSATMRCDGQSAPRTFHDMIAVADCLADFISVSPVASPDTVLNILAQGLLGLLDEITVSEAGKCTLKACRDAKACLME